MKIKKLVDQSLEEKEVRKSKMIAKKDFKIVHNNYVREIKAGDDVSDVPSNFINNLKTENVL